jgi:hypothetical protein
MTSGTRWLRAGIAAVLISGGVLVSSGSDVASANGDLEALTPARLLETRPGKKTVDGKSQGVGRRSAGKVTELVVAGRGGVPGNASAVPSNAPLPQVPFSGGAAPHVYDHRRAQP